MQSQTVNQPVSQVLLVEDDPRLPELLAGLLHDDNVTLANARNASEALALVRKRHFDLILLDLALPGLSGFEVLRQLKESPQTRATPVIVLTAWNAPADKLRGFELGAADCLTRPFETAELRARLRAALRAKRLRGGLTQANRELLAACAAAKTLAGTKAESLANISQEAPVDMGRFLDFTNGNPDDLRELVTLYLDQTRGQLTQLETAVRAAAPQEVRRLAHSCAGASGTCGMRRLVPLLRELEREGCEGRLTHADQLCRQAAAEFESIRQFLEAYLTTRTNPASRT
jgi:DNA-binding response OmpR family regulator